MSERNSPAGFEPDAFELGLLDSARKDAGSPRALARAMAVWGGVAAAVSSAGAAAAGSGTATGTAATVGSTGSTLLVVAKWTSLGLLGGFIAAGTASRYVETPRDGSTSEPSAARLIASSGAQRSPRPIPAEVAAPVAATGPPPRRRLAAPPPDEQNTPALPSSATSSIAPGPASAAFPPFLPRAPSLLSRELAELERARGAMTSGNPKRALDILERYDGTFPEGALRQEATLLHVEALLRIGERRRAREVARRVLDVDAHGPHALRLRSLLGHGAGARN